MKKRAGAKMSESKRPPDHPISEKQRGVIDWFAAYLRMTVPDECYESNRAWWRFLNMNLTRHHIDIANEMRSDFGLSVDLYDPVSVIHALKYDEAVRRNEKSGRELLWERAKELLIGGVHPYSAEDQFPFTEAELFVMIREVEAGGHPIEGF